MLIETLSFELVNFKARTVEEYLIENTPENVELLFGEEFARGIETSTGKKFIRGIATGQMFDFQLRKEEKFPAELMHVNANEFENEFCDTDEMVGMVL